MSRFASVAVLCGIVLVFVIPSLAQVPDPAVAASAPQPGSEHSYIGMGAETVNPADGQVTFDLPIPTPAGRQLSFPFGIRFNAAENWHLTIPGTDVLGQFQWAYQGGGNGVDGWSYDVPYLTAQEFAQQMWLTTIGYPLQYVQHQCDAASNFVFRGLDGRQYTLNLAGGVWNDGAYTGTNPNDCVGNYPYDGPTTSNNHGIVASYPPGYTGWPLFPPVTVVDQSGTSYYFSNLGGTYGAIAPNSPVGAGGIARTITDRNGNQISLNGNSLGYTDTLGRTVVSWDHSIGSASTSHITVSGLASNIVVQWSTGSVGGANYPMSGYELSGTATCTVPTTGPSIGNQGITEIDYPNGQSYKFGYNSTYGTISQITFPDGGSVRYAWGLNHSGAQKSGSWWFNDGNGYQAQENCTIVYDVPAITDRWVNDGTKDVLHQVFSYCNPWISSCPSRQTTTVTNYDLVTGSTSIAVYSYGGLCPDQTPYAPNCPVTIPMEVGVTYQDGSGHALKIVNQEGYGPYSVVGSQTVLDNGQTMTELRCLDANEQITSVYEYGFPSEGSYPGDPSKNNPLCGSSNPFPAAIGPLRRETVTAYHPFFQGFDKSGNMLGTHIVDEPDNTTVYDGAANQLKQTSFGYDQTAVATSGAQTGLVSPPGVRGNTTSVTQWLSTGSSPATTYTYYNTGQVYTMTDPCGQTGVTCSDMTGATHTTTYSYADAFSIGTPPGQTNAYLTKVTDPLGHISTFTYGYSDGKLTGAKDPNGQASGKVTTYKNGTEPSGCSSQDYLDRLTEVDYPDGGVTTYCYNDAGLTMTATKLVDSSSNTNIVTTSLFDGMGHVVQTELVSDPDGPTYSATAYDGSGRVYTKSNPYRTTSDPTYGITTYTYDALGRTTKVAEPDGSAVTTFFSGNCTTVTDEASNTRQSCADGLGRMTKVLEDPGSSPHLNYETDYSYDAVNNLLSVTQNGSRARTFTYDSLSRLLCAANPEVQIVTCPAPGGTFPTGTITYSYDRNSNLSTRVVPKANQTGTLQTTHNYTYDVLNRLVQESHIDPSAGTEKYAYDGTALTGCPGPSAPSINSPTNQVGRRSAMCSVQSSSSWSYDPMGRTLFEATANKGTSTKGYTVGYTYFKDGSLNTLAYPSGDVVTYKVGGAGRTTQVTDSANTPFVAPPASSPMYAPHGALVGMTSGTGIVTSNAYNNRLQPFMLSAGVNGQSAIFSLCYDFHLHVAISNTTCGSLPVYTTGDNGNVFQVFNKADSTRSTAFTYDPLNRISQANTVNTTSSNCWGETYTIDAWGNLAGIAAAPGMAGNCVMESLSATATTQNQLSGIGMKYDAAGNVTKDNLGNMYTYDGENRISTVAGYTYNYDADGARMEKAAGSTGTMYWMGPSGALAETDLTGAINEEYIFFNGARIARVDRPSGNVHYYFSDQLASTSVITSPTAVIQERYYYYPYGGMQSSTGSDPNHYKFTGKERDSESGLDNFGARYDASSLGRFMTPDWAAKPTTVPYASFGDPQTLNLYSYVRNNPLSRNDPDGHEIVLAGDQDKQEELKRIAANASKTDKNGLKESSLFKEVTDKKGKTTMALDKVAAANFKGEHSGGYNLLVGAINAKQTITVEMSESESRTIPGANGNFTVNLNRNVDPLDRISPLRGYDGQKIPNPFQIIAGHEVLGHAYSSGILGLTKGMTFAQEEVWVRQNVENTLRYEQGIPLRDPYSN